MALKYTICFCRCRDRVLLVHRNRPPNQYFLPAMFASTEPREYFCDYRDEGLVAVVIRPFQPSSTR